MTLPTIQVLAISKNSEAPTNGLKKSGNDHLYLFQKESVDWEIVEDPKWAKMNINNKKNTFVFNAHGLTPDADFELICYLDPWPGEGSIILGTGTSDAEGNIHIKKEIDVVSLHAEALAKFENYPAETVLEEGSKIWLVPAADFDETETQQKMVAWNPDQILFEFDLLNQPPTE